jgi:hypothetical protein
MSTVLQILGLFILGTIANALIAFAANALNRSMYRNTELLLAWTLARRDTHIAYGLCAMIGAGIVGLATWSNDWTAVGIMAAIISFSVLWQACVTVIQHFDLRNWMKPTQLQR